MKNVTIKDVAKAAGVSYSTVSRALSGNPEISADTRAKILKLCKEMNYTMNTAARSMVVKNTKRLGLIIPSLKNPFMAELAHYVNRQARTRGYSVVLCNSDRESEIEQELFELMIGHQVDGIILIPCGADTLDHLSSYMSRIPTVFLGESLRDVSESYVSVDNYRGAYIGVEYLYQLGHREILYFGRRRNSITHQLRANGYEAACQAFGIKPHFFDNSFSRSSIKYGYELAMQLFAQTRNYSAIFAATDTNAIGIMRAAEELGIKIPDELSLLGFDNIPISNYPHIHLTTIDQPKRMMASLAVETLLEKIQNDLSGYSHRIVMPTLIERASCAPPLHKAAYPDS